MDKRTDVEAERRVLSSILHSENACVTAFNALNDDDFTYQMHREAFGLAFSLYTRNVIPTYVEVLKEGHSLGWLETLDDLSELKYIAEQYINERNTEYWIDRVKCATATRKAHYLLMKYGEEIRKNDLNIASLIQSAGADFMSLALNCNAEDIEDAATIAKLGSETIADNVERWRRLEEEARLNGVAPMPLEGLDTGFPNLNKITLGYKPGDLIILGAQTGHGKTAFAINTAKSSCFKGNESLLYVNTEMSRQQIMYRWAAVLTGISLQRIRTGSLTDAELGQVKEAFKEFSKSPLYTAHMPNLTPHKLDIIARKARLQHNIKLLILDYVGRMEKHDPKLQEWQVLEQIIKTQKILAQNLKIAVMVLVQLNEDGSLQGAKRMKNECDLMLKLLPIDADQADKLREYHRVNYEALFNYRLHIDKSRDSVAGIDIPLVFDKTMQLIREARAEETGWEEYGRVTGRER